MATNGRKISTEALVSLMQEEDANIAKILSTLKGRKGKAAIDGIALQLANKTPGIRDYAFELLKMRRYEDVRATMVDGLGAVRGNATILLIDFLAEKGEKSAVPGLIEILNSKKSSKIREHAAGALAAIGGKDAAKALIAIADDNSQKKDVRENCLFALGYVGGEDALNTAIKALRSNGPEMRETAVNAIGKMGRGVPKVMVSSMARGETVEAIGRVGVDRNIRKKAEAALVGMLNDRNEYVKGEAVEMLRMMRAKGAVDALAKLINKKWEEPQIRARAMYALDEIGGKEAKIALAKASDVDLAGADEEVALAIIGIGNGGISVKALGSALLNESDTVKANAARALGEKGGRGAVDALIGALKGNALVRERAAESLGNLGGIEAGNALASLLETEKDPEVRQYALVSLARMGDTRALHIARGIAERGANPFICTNTYELGAALFVLGEMGDGSMIPLLDGMCGHGNEIIRGAASDARLQLEQRLAKGRVPAKKTRIARR